MFFKAAALSSLAIVLLAATAPTTSLVMSGRERASYEKGRALQRVVDAIQDPRRCAVVAFRARCVADFDRAFGDAKQAPLPELRAAFANGDLRGVLDKVKDMNTARLPDTVWTDDAHGAWLETAGETSVALPAADGNMMLQLFASIAAEDLARHAASAGPFAALLPEADAKLIAQATPAPPVDGLKNVTETGLPYDRIAPYETALAAKLEAAFPSPAFPLVSYPDGVVGDLRAGVAVATVNQLIEQPEALLEPDVQAFVDGLFIALRAIAGEEARQEFDTARESLRPKSIVGLVAAARDKKQTVDPYAPFLKAVHRIPRARYPAVLYGMLAAQGAYNAVVLRDESAAAAMQRIVGTDPAYDPLVANLSPARTALAQVKPKDWVGLNRAHAAVVAAILAAP